MKKFFKIFLILVLALVIVSIIISAINLQTPGEPIYHQALEVRLNQVQENVLQLTSMQIIDTYPSDNKFTHSFKNYYLLQMQDAKNKVLFETVTAKSEILSFFTDPRYPQRPPLVILKKELNLFLPVYQKAVKLLVSNESGQEIMNINLKGIIKQKSSNIKQRLCGNGICDQSENFINCFTDCGLK